MEEIYIEQTSPKTVFKTILLILFILGILIGGYLYFHNKNILKVKNVVVELGEKLPKDIKNYIRNDVKNINDYEINLNSVSVDSSGNTNEVGKFSYSVKYDNQEKSGKVEVKDTTPPTATLHTLTIGVSEEFLLNDLIDSCDDLSLPCKVTLKNKKDSKVFSQVGNHYVAVKVSDKYNNYVTKKANIIVSNSNTLLGEKETDFTIVRTDPSFEDYDNTITFKYEKCVSEEHLDELEEYNDYLELVSTDYSELREQAIIEQEILTLYNKYDYIIGFTVRLTYDDGTIEYVE